jgi:hypothetical protein
MRLLCYLLVCSVFAGAAAPALAQSGLARVWAIDDGEKVKADDLQHWGVNSPLNPVWDGTTVRLFGGRNEFVAFQVILESSSGGATEVAVQLDSLASGAAVIRNHPAANGPYDLRGRRIEIFLQHYIDVTDRSPWNGSWGWGGSRPLPDPEHTGWIPDALIPIEAPPGEKAHGAGGAPFSIAPRRNQGIWVDIYIDRTVPPGFYRGTLLILERGAMTHALPVSLEVMHFTLPDTTHFRNFADLTEQLVELHGVEFGSPAFREIYRRYMHLGHRHRMDFSQGAATVQTFRDWLGGYYSGMEYLPAAGYDGPGEGIGNTTFSIGTYDQPEWGYGSGFWPNTEADWWRAADEWEGWFQQNAPSTLRFKYMTDEPPRAAWPTVIERAGWLHRNPGLGRNLRTFCTVPMAPELRGSVDVWALTGQSGYEEDGITYGYVLKTADSLRVAGNLVGIYNGTRPAYGQMSALDNFATDCRVTPWIGWKYGVDFYFLWEVGQYAASRKNSWSEQYWVLDGKKMWGDGQFVYAGEDKLFPEDSRGLPGPIASIRLKNWRRGQQDYEYLWMARQRGIDPQSILDRVVPRAFDDYDGTSYRSQGGQPVWATRGHVFEEARRALAQLLQGTTKTVSLPTVQFSAHPLQLPHVGGDVQLSWTTEYAEAATVDQGVGRVELSGSRMVRVTSTTVFTLHATNQAGEGRSTVTVTVEQPPTGGEPALIRNGTFASGTASWSGVWSGGGSLEACSLSASRPHVAALKVTSPGGNIQLFQSGVRLEPSYMYRLTFDAKSNGRRSFEVSLLKHGAPFSPYCDAPRMVQSDTLWRTHVLDFSTRVLTDAVSDARLMFWLAPFAGAGDEYLFDNVQLERTAPAPRLDTIAVLPADYILQQNYPNPFNPSTNIRFTLFEPARAAVTVYDLLGRQIASLADGEFPAGTHEFRFDASGLAPGVYYYRLRAGSYVQTRSMILLK